MVMQHGKQKQTRVVDQFDATDMGAPFRVVLHNSVRVTTDAHGEIQSYTIPDPDGLSRAIVVSRILHSRKLSGKEIKWLRKAVGRKQKEAAAAISLSAEHLSRCEAGNLVMSAGSEKLLRLYLFKSAEKLHAVKECEEKRKLEELLGQLFEGHDPIPAHNAEDEMVLHLERRRRVTLDAGNDNDDGWDDVKLAAAN